MSSKSFFVSSLVAIAASLVFTSCTNNQQQISGLKILPVQCKNNKYGFIDLDGKLVIPPTFDSFSFIDDDEYVFVSEGNKLGYISLRNRSHIYPQFDFTIPFQEGLAVVMIDSKWGYIDKTGKIAIPLQFDDARQFQNGLAAIAIMDKWGYIDKTGKIVIPLQFDSARTFEADIAPVRVGEKWGYIDQAGKIVIPLQFDSVMEFHNGLAPVMIDNKWGYIDQTGQMILPPLLDNSYWIQQNPGSVKLSGYITISDEFFDMTIYQNFKLVDAPNQFFPSLQVEVKFGLLDKTGKVILPREFDYIYLPLNEMHGLVYAEKNGKAWYIDQSGKIVLSEFDC